jgi:hypothetical protein
MQPTEGDPAPGATDATPSETTPTDGQPATDASPSEGTPAEGTPAEGTPAEGTPAEGEGTAPAEGEGAAPVEEAATDSAEPADATAEADAAGEDVIDIEGPANIDTPTEPKIGKWPAKGTGMMISGGVLLGLGIGGLITSILVTNCPEGVGNTYGCKNQDNREFLVPIAASVMTVGAVLLIVGGTKMAKYKKWQRTVGTTQAVVPTFTRSGAGLTYIARF